MVFNDSVVYKGQLFLPVGMGMGIALTGLAMGGPTRMADACRSLYRIQLEKVFQLFDLAFLFANFKFAFVDSSNSG